MKTVAELAKIVEGKVSGDGSVQITGITNLEQPLAGHIAFVEEPRRLKELEASPIACLIVSPKIEASKKPLIQVTEPKLAWTKLLNLFFPSRNFPGTISKQAFVDPTAQLGSGVTVEPFAYVGEKTVVGDGAVIRAYAYVDRNVRIGEKTVLHPHVMIYENSVVGNRCTLHAGSTIGADGFGYVATPGGQVKVPQAGNVILEDEVEVGACSTIDRATVGSTRIGKGVKIDNLVQIAHNVTIGSHTVICAQTGISGSSAIGSFVTLGGRVGLGDHVKVGDETMLGAGSGAPTGKKIPPKQIWFGTPVRPYPEARRQYAAQLRSAEMMEEVRKLRSRIVELEERVKPASRSN